MKELSKGMVAKVKLILALSHAPECLILDEPTSGLDPGSRNDLLILIGELRRERGISTLFSSHNLDDVADIATHIGILHEGRLIFSAPSSLIRDNLRLLEFAMPLPDPPPEVKSQIVCSRSQDGITQLVIVDRDDAAVRTFIDGIGRENMQERPLTLKKLFLFLTSARLVE
jgi:ABC-2 type transport system ATP-binding protein